MLNEERTEFRIVETQVYFSVLHGGRHLITKAYVKDQANLRSSVYRIS